MNAWWIALIMVAVAVALASTFTWVFRTSTPRCIAGQVAGHYAPVRVALLDEAFDLDVVVDTGVDTLCLQGNTLNEGDRVVLSAQSLSRQNGIWEWHAKGWQRAADFNDIRQVVVGATTMVTHGKHAGKRLVVQVANAGHLLSKPQTHELRATVVFVTLEDLFWDGKRQKGDILMTDEEGELSWQNPTQAQGAHEVGRWDFEAEANAMCLQKLTWKKEWLERDHETLWALYCNLYNDNNDLVHNQRFEFLMSPADSKPRVSLLYSQSSPKELTMMALNGNGEKLWWAPQSYHGVNLVITNTSQNTGAVRCHARLVKLFSASG